ncbi:MAG: PLP-dependent aminotransferase family protein [Pseudomonadota bacterium]
MQEDGKHLYEKVAEVVGNMVQRGTLRPGDKVPSLRALSRKLKVSVATVMQAYLVLENRGMIESRPQSGFYVKVSREKLRPPRQKRNRSQSPRKVQFGNTVETIFALANQPDVVPLGVANPAPSLLPVTALGRAVRDVMNRTSDHAISYDFPPGEPELRRNIALRSADIGVEVDPDDVLITNGATEGLMVALQTVAKAGDVIAVAAPAYFNVLQMIEKLGMLVVEVESDPHTGVDLDALAEWFDRQPIAAIVVWPNFANPTGALMSDANKSALVALCNRHKTPLIEDDVMGDLSFSGDRPRNCKAYDTEGNVITVSSFSKTLAPGFRIGWTLGGQYHADMMQQKQLNSSASNSLSQLAMTRFLKEGHYDRHLVRLRRAYQQQVQHLRFGIAEHFPAGTRVSDPSGGFVVWVELPAQVDSQTVYDKALRSGISVTPGLLFSSTGRYNNYLRLCAGHPWDATMQEAIKTLGRIVTRLAQ